MDHKEKRPFINIVDEAFIVRRTRVLEFCAALKKLDVPLDWSCFGRIDRMDEELMGKMKDAGCRRVFFGVESGSNAVLERVKKQFTIKQAMRTLLSARNYFESITASFIWGFPFETFEDLMHTQLAIAILKDKGVKTQLHLLAPVRASEIYREYRDAMVFDAKRKDLDEMYPLFPEPEAFIRFVEENEAFFPGYSHFKHLDFNRKEEFLKKKSTTEGTEKG